MREHERAILLVHVLGKAQSRCRACQVLLYHYSSRLPPNSRYLAKDDYQFGVNIRVFPALPQV
jgi:hypothetical protein